MDVSDSIQEIYLVMTTEVDQENAYEIADLLLKDKLTPCVSFKSIESCFWWDGKINKAKEVQLLIKCKEENINKVCNRISECHSYELPEIIYFPVSANKDYYQWVESF